MRIEQAERLGVKINSKLAKTVRNAQGNFTIGTDSLEQNSINGISDIQKMSQINKGHKKFGAGEYSFMQNNDQNSFLSGLETGRSLQTQRIKQQSPIMTQRVNQTIQPLDPAFLKSPEILS